MASRKQVEAAFEERLDLTEPDLWNPDDYVKFEKMATNRGNAKLERVFDESETDLPKLIASVRWSIFGEPYARFAQSVGISPNGYQPMEQDIGPNQAPHKDKYTKLLEHWKQNDISPGIREQMLELLTPEDSLYSFWQRVGYDVGHAAVEEYEPNFYNRLWQHSRMGTVQKAHEAVRLMDEFYPPARDMEDQVRADIRHGQAEQMWKGEKLKQYERREVEESLAQILTGIEWDLARNYDSTFRHQALMDVYGYSPKPASKLTQAELISWELVEDIAFDLFDEDTFEAVREAYQQDIETEQQRKSFEKTVRAMLQKNELSAADIGRFLEIQPPEERREGYEDPKRKQRYRPDAVVRSVAFENGHTTLVPVAPMIATVAAGDKKDAELLREAYVAERRRYYKRTNSGLDGDGFAMRMQREFAGVDMKGLARLLLPDGVSEDEIHDYNLALQRLERGESRIPDDTDFATIKKVLHEVEQRRTARALEMFEHRNDIPPELYDWETLSEMAHNLCAMHRSSKTVTELMKETAEHDGLWIRDDLIRQMREGTYVPPLPAVRAMAEAAAQQSSLSNEIINDWYAQYPQYLKSKEEHPVENQLGRILMTLVASKEAGNATRFFAERYTGGDPTQAPNKFFKLHRYGEYPDWEFVESTLKSAGVRRNDPAWKAAEVLWETDGDEKAAITAAREVLKQRKFEVHPVHVPGFTMEELSSVRTSKKASNGGRKKAKNDSINELL